MKPKFFLTLLISLSLYSICGAWGAAGHKIVAKIAYNRVTQSVKDSINKYLGFTTVEEAAVWMDEIKSNHSYDSLTPWHYLDIDKGGTFDTLRPPNILWGLKRVIGELKERQKFPKDHVEMDLKILFHLMGDLHQPLHTGFPGDRGGNSIQVYYAGNATNLHRVWDTEILESEILGHSLDWANTSKLSKEELKKIQHIDLVEWMNDSRSNLDSVYAFKNGTLNRKYVKRSVPIIQKQLLKGGLRLATLLQVIFG